MMKTKKRSISMNTGIKLCAVIVLFLSAIFAPSALPVRAQQAQGPLGIDLDRRYDENIFLGTHNAYASRKDENNNDEWITPNQDPSLSGQLDEGVRLINLDIWLVRQGHYGAAVPGDPCLPGTRAHFAQVLEGPEDEEINYALYSCFKRGLEVVVAHDLPTWQYALYKQDYFKTLRASLEVIKVWLDAHPQEVVTIVLENHVDENFQDYVRSAFSVVDPYLFYVDRKNDGMEVPDRPGEEWEVSKHGFPTLRRMIEEGKRLVLLPDDNHPGVPDYKPWKYQVNTVYGGDSITASGGKWTNYRDESRPINDFTRPLFLMEHAPCCPGVRPVSGNNFNGYDFLLNRWSEEADGNNLRSKWDRMPNYVMVDFYDHDKDHLLGEGEPVNDPSGPMQFVSYLNSLRNSLPRLTATATVEPAANAAGWNNTDVTVRLGATGDVVRSFVMSGFGAQSLELREYPATGPVGAVISGEGTTTVSFAAIGRNTIGLRSDQRLVDVRIDKQAPRIEESGNAGSYVADQTINITCTATDEGSGLQTPAQTVISGPAYLYGPGEVSIPVVARDKADNETVFYVRFYVVVTFSSMTNLTGQFVTHGGTLTSLLAKLDAAQMAEDRGDLAQKAQHISTYINEIQNQTGRFITAEYAAILIRFAQAL